MEIKIKDEFYEKIKLMIREEMKNITIDLNVNPKGRDIDEVISEVRAKLKEVLISFE